MKQSVIAPRFRYNTGHPHVHVIVRDRDDLGENLVINGDYLANGIR